MSAVTYTRNNLSPDMTKTWPQFFTDTVIDEAASQREGRKICRDEERVRVIMPGNQLNIPVFKVTDEHRQRWPDHYKAFQEGRDLPIDGIALEEWPVLTRAMVEELKYLKFRTVEQIADAPDTAIQRIGMGGFNLRDRARAFLDDAHRLAQNEQLSKENETLKNEVARLSTQVEELGATSQRVLQELLTLRDAPHPLATHVPGLHDPLQPSPQAEVSAGSALDALSRPRRGRPPKAA